MKTIDELSEDNRKLMLLIIRMADILGEMAKKYDLTFLQEEINQLNKAFKEYKDENG